MGDNFDPCCDFLLDLAFENLFEPVGRDDQSFRCKGCRAHVSRQHRKHHHNRHLAGRVRAQKAYEREVNKARRKSLEKARNARRRMV